MADLLIRGMALPPKGKYLHLRIETDGKISGQINKDAYFCSLADVDEKAIEVPPHGDLIDRAELLKKCPEWGYSPRQIKEADTIIPASKEGGE